MKNGLRYFLAINGDENLFTVVRFAGVEALSQLFSFSLQLYSPNDTIAISTVTGKKATLRILSDSRNDTHLYHGIITSLMLTHKADQGAVYEAVLSPQLWTLANTQESQIFLSPNQHSSASGLAIRDVLTEAMQSAGIATTSYDFSKIQTNFSRRYVCQYQESHMTFCKRWLEYLGASYYFTHHTGQDVLVATDSGKWPQLTPSALNFVAPANLSAFENDIVYSIRENSRQVPAQVMVKDYNPDKPTQLIQSKAPISERGRGVIYIYDDDPRSQEEADFIAGRRAEAYAAIETTYDGCATAVGMRPGYTFTLKRHHRAHFNQTYLIISVKHTASQASLLTKLLPVDLRHSEKENAYHCEFSCCKADVPYRPLRETPWPQVAGILNAKIDAEGSGEYAELNEEGKYKVIMPFDQSGRNGGKASCYLRMAQPYAGDRNGMHFPLTKGTEVLISFADGDPDRPYIHASIPNPSTPSPVTQNNQTQLGITTLSQTSITMDDKAGSEAISLYSPVQKTNVILGSFVPLVTPIDVGPNLGNIGLLQSSGQDHVEEISAGRFETIKGSKFAIVSAGNYSSEVQGGTRTESSQAYKNDITGYMKSTYKTNATTTITNDFTCKVSGNLSINEAKSGQKYTETITTNNKKTFVIGQYSATLDTTVFTSSDTYFQFATIRTTKTAVRHTYASKDILEIGLIQCNETKKYIATLNNTKRAEYIGILTTIIPHTHKVSDTFSLGLKALSLSATLGSLTVTGLSIGMTGFEKKADSIKKESYSFFTAELCLCKTSLMGIGLYKTTFLRTAI